MVKGIDSVCKSRSYPGALKENPINLYIFSPVPELSFLPTPNRGLTRAGERRVQDVQDNLHAHVQNKPIKNY